MDLFGNNDMIYIKCNNTYEFEFIIKYLHSIGYKSRYSYNNRPYVTSYKYFMYVSVYNKHINDPYIYTSNLMQLGNKMYEANSLMHLLLLNIL